MEFTSYVAKTTVCEIRRTIVVAERRGLIYISCLGEFRNAFLVDADKG